MQLLRKCRYPSRSWQGNIPKVDSRDWLLLESISSFIYILLMRAGSLNERGGNDLGICSKVVARSAAGPEQTLWMSLSAKKTTFLEAEESCRSPQRLNCTNRSPRHPGWILFPHLVPAVKTRHPGRCNTLQNNSFHSTWGKKLHKMVISMLAQSSFNLSS